MGCACAWSVCERTFLDTLVVAIGRALFASLRSSSDTNTRRSDIRYTPLVEAIGGFGSEPGFNLGSLEEKYQCPNSKSKKVVR